MYQNAVSMLGVAILWGVTNPLIKRGTKGIEKVTANSKLKQLQLELKFLVTNPGYLMPMGLNQMGSLLYFFTLQDAKLSLIVPVTNSLTFLITTITSVVLGEKFPSKQTCAGMLLIFLGALCCFFDKS